MTGLTSADGGSSHITGVSYVGIAKYCYANSVAMLLAGINEHVSPSLVEVLTGVGLGACLETDGLLYFSQLTGNPDIGISKAMEFLGFSFEEKSSEHSDSDPFQVLEYDLQNSSAILGPLDMSYLVYIPGHQYIGGVVDHFVLAYAIDRDKLYLHDPAGYPHVSITRPEMLLAWKAENIYYRRGYYRCWASPKRIASPSGAEVYQQALRWFKSIYEDSSAKGAKENMAIGSDAIRKVADRIEAEVLSREEAGHLSRFALQLGAKRALDFASFFGPYDRTLANLKYHQSRVFGEAHSCLLKMDWASTAYRFRLLADLAEKVQDEIMSR